MEQGLVTVVIPVYNTEKYLDQCVQSVVNQTYKNLEILLIDDGSPDRCPQKCDGWAEKDKRIRVIHKQNEGLGMARNTGIEQARGEFICFFDSDDFVSADTIEKAIERQRQTNAQIVVFGFQHVNAEGITQSYFSPVFGSGVVVGKQVQNEFLPELIAPDPAGDGKKSLYMSACMMLFSMELIQTSGWCFTSERTIISEDVYSLLELFRVVERVAVLSESCYCYRFNTASLSRTYQPNRYEKIRFFYTECIALCDRLGYGEEIKHRISKPYLAFALAALKQELQGIKGYKACLSSIRKIIDDEILQQVLEKNKRDHVSLTRRIMFWTIRNKYYSACHFMLYIKTKNRR